MSDGSAATPPPWGTRLRSFREADRHETREEFAAAIGCDARLLARWERGEVRCPRPFYRRRLAKLGAPLPPPAMPAPWAADPGTPSLDESSDSRDYEALHSGQHRAGGDDPTRRRDLLKTATLAGAASLLPSGPRQAGGLDDATPAALHAVTGAQRRLDAALPAHELAESAGSQSRLTHQLAEQTSRGLWPGMAAAASEAAGFAAWLHFDMVDLGTAARYYRRAIFHARRTGNSLLSGYMLGSLAAFEVENGDSTRAAALLDQTAGQFGSAPPPAALAWLSSLQALAMSTQGHASATDEYLRIADSAASRAQNAEAPWPWVFPFDPAKVAGYHALCAVRLARPTEALAIFTQLDAPRSPKQAALSTLERAHAHIQAQQPDEGFDLARDALATGVRTQSERVKRRARHLRRRYQGPETRTVRAFDEQLRQIAA